MTSRAAVMAAMGARAAAAATMSLSPVVDWPPTVARVVTLAKDHACALCPRQIPAGTECWQFRESKWAHPDCGREVYHG